MNGTEEWISVPKRGGTAKSPKLEGSENNSSKLEGSGNVAAAQVVIILVGLPGSGKSWFASQLQRGDSRFVRINQDALGTRKKCEDSSRQALSRGESVIIDRCNFDSTQRQHWINIAKQEFGLPCHCVVFNYNKEECIRRCKERVGHETINYGNAAMVVRGMAKKFRPPLPHSGQYQRHITINSFRQANEVVQSYLDRGSCGS